MAGLFDTEAPALPAPTTTGKTPEETLLAVLKATGDLQGQPLIPNNNPLLAIGAALSGFAAGTQGKPNPTLKMLMEERELGLRTMMNQASIAGTLSSMEQQRASREATERRLRFDMEKEKTDTAEKARSFAFNAGTKMTESDNVEEREQGYRMLQRVTDPHTNQPILGPTLDPKRLALMRGKDFTAKWDRAIDMVMVGVEPPATEYDRTVFPVDQWKTMDAVQLAAQRRGTAPTESALKAEYTAIASLDPKQRTPEQARRMAAIKEGLTLSSAGQNTVLALAKARKEKDQQTPGAVVKDDADYISQAFKETDRSESFEKDLKDEADRLKSIGTLRDEAAVFAWKDGKRKEYQRAIAEVKAGATPLSSEWGTQIAVLRDTKAALVEMYQQFSPEERAQFAGWFNYNVNQVRNALRGQNPATADMAVKKFAQFKALLGRIQNYAFSQGGKQLTEGEKEIVFLGIPTGKEISATDFEVKLKSAYGQIDRITEDKITLATSPKDFIRRMPRIEATPDAVNTPAQTAPPPGFRRAK